MGGFTKCEDLLYQACLFAAKLLCPAFSGLVQYKAPLTSPLHRAQGALHRARLPWPCGVGACVGGSGCPAQGSGAYAARSSL